MRKIRNSWLETANALTAGIKPNASAKDANKDRRIVIGNEISIIDSIVIFQIGVSMSKGKLLLTLAHPGLHVNLRLCVFSRLGMSGPKPFDVSDNLAPHISFFMCVCGFFFG